MSRNRLVAVALIAGSLTVGFTGYEAARRAVNVASFSDSGMLRYAWEDYKRRFWEAPTGRIVNHANQDRSTSEGQSYAMLRAVWMDDRPMFDQTWRWTRETLQHSDNYLFAWHYGKRPDGRMGVLYEEGGANAATDADTDIALALILGAARWGDRTLQAQAREIVNDIWRYEVVSINGSPYLMADELERRSALPLVVNPSYFEPYAFRLFALLDRQHPWTSLIDTSYALLARSIDEPLDAGGSAGLPPDWIRIERSDARISLNRQPPFNSEFGADAYRTPWRMAVDWQWNGDERDRRILARMSPLSSYWNRYRRIPDRFRHNGSPTSSEEALALYGATLGYFLVMDPEAASAIFQSRIAGAFSHSTRSWGAGYYDENWLWFGAALKGGLIRDFGAFRMLAAPDAATP